MALLGAITHQTLAAWAPAGGRSSFFGRFAPCPPAAFANAIVVLYVAAALLGAIIYLYFRVDVRPELERDGHWQALGFFDLKEDFVAIGLGLLPAYWTVWRRPLVDDLWNAHGPDRDPGLHRLVGLPRRSRPKQHHGLRVMTPQPHSAGSPSPSGRPSRSLRGRGRKGLALFTVFPSLGIVLPGSIHSRDVADPAMGFLAPAMYWYGWAATAALGALVVGLIAAVASQRLDATNSGLDGCGWYPVVAMIACVYLTLPWFRL